jgi:hypothetical protein
MKVLVTDGLSLAELAMRRPEGRLQAACRQRQLRTVAAGQEGPQ